MATRSFVTEFKFNPKSGRKLIRAIERSKIVNHEIKQKVINVNNEERINKIMNSFLRKDV